MHVFLWGRRVRWKLKSLLRYVETMMDGVQIFHCPVFRWNSVDIAKIYDGNFSVLDHYSPDSLRGQVFLGDFKTVLCLSVLFIYYLLMYVYVYWQVQARGSTMPCLGYVGAIRKPGNLLLSQSSSLKIPELCWLSTFLNHPMLVNVWCPGWFSCKRKDLGEIGVFLLGGTRCYYKSFTIL